jgi:DNA processing protein
MLSRDLAHRGLIILSGMARGVDTSAHKGALAAKRPTIAVWGTRIDVIYPKENKSLSEQIIGRRRRYRVRVSVRSLPTPQNFPKRNRILSGMSIGVLVIEAAEYSGTRVTARCAIEQNRDVYAVPGNVTTKNAWGPNMLIKQGAKLTATWEDVWEELPTPVRLKLESKHPLASKQHPAASLFAVGRFLQMKPASCRLCATMRRLSLTRSWKSLSLNSAPPKASRHSSSWSYQIASGNFLAKITSRLSEHAHVGDHHEYACFVVRRKNEMHAARRSR